MKGKIKLALSLIIMTVICSIILTFVSRADKDMAGIATSIFMQSEDKEIEQYGDFLMSDEKSYTSKENPAIDSIEVNRILSESDSIRDKLSLICLIVIVCCVIVLWVTDTLRKRVESSWKYRF